MKKNLLLVGATGGIGNAILHEMYADYNIIATGTKKESLELLSNDYPEIKTFVFNHTNNQEADLIEHAAAVFEKIDCIIVASGITSDGLSLKLSDEAWDLTLQVNLTSVFKILKNGYRKMNKNSSIVLISSVIARLGNIGQVAYSASKGGLEAMAKTLAKEFASKCTVNVVAPGFIETNMTKNLDHAKIIETIPLKRMGLPSEVACAVKFLAKAGYITGHTLEINGGMLMI